MENKKSLKVSTAVCDVRFATEETLSAYEQVSVSCATLISSPQARALLARHQVKIATAHTIEVEGSLRTSTVNGVMKLIPGQVPAEEKTFLMVNGQLDVAPGCEELLKSYAAVIVNGTVDAPESMTGLLGGVTVNGAICTYPDGAIRLRSTVVLDRTFPLRAKQGALYHAAGRIVALSGDIDFAKLAEKDVRFSTKKLVVAESLAEAALPLFDERADIQIVPNGCAYLDDDAELTEALVRRRGGRLYVNGDVTLLEDGPWLDQVTYLRAEGDMLVAGDLEDRLDAMDAVYEDLYVVGGTLLTGRSNVRITREMLEGAERGLSVVSCATVEVDEDVPVQLLRDRLVSIVSCANVECTKEQCAVIEPAAHGVASIGPVKDEDEEEEDSDTVRISAAFYTL